MLPHRAPLAACHLHTPVCRKRFGDKAFNMKLQEELRKDCVQKIIDPKTKLGRKSRMLVHNLNDMIVDLGARALAMRTSRVHVQKPDEPAAEAAAVTQQAEQPEEQGRSKVPRTSR